MLEMEKSIGCATDIETKNVTGYVKCKNRKTDQTNVTTRP